MKGTAHLSRLMRHKIRMDETGPPGTFVSGRFASSDIPEDEHEIRTFGTTVFADVLRQHYHIRAEDIKIYMDDMKRPQQLTQPYLSVDDDMQVYVYTCGSRHGTAEVYNPQLNVEPVLRELKRRVDNEFRGT